MSVYHKENRYLNNSLDPTHTYAFLDEQLLLTLWKGPFLNIFRY